MSGTTLLRSEKHVKRLNTSTHHRQWSMVVAQRCVPELRGGCLLLLPTASCIKLLSLISENMSNQSHFPVPTNESCDCCLHIQMQVMSPKEIRLGVQVSSVSNSHFRQLISKYRIMWSKPTENITCTFKRVSDE